MPLLAVRTLHASTFQVGLLTAAETAAFLLVGLPAGAWVDRMRRRPVLVAADVGRALLLASVPAAWWSGVLTMAQLYAVVLLVGLLTVFFDVAAQSFLPALVGRPGLVEGNAKLEIPHAAADAAGPALGGGLVQVVTAPVAVLADAVSYVVSATLLAGIRTVEGRPGRAAGARLRAEIGEGLGFVLRHPLLRAIAGCTGSYNLFFSAAFAVQVVFLARVLHLSAATIGGLFSAGAVGGLVGAFAAERVARTVGQARTIWLAPLATSPFLLLVPLAEPGWRLACFAGGTFAAYAGGIAYNVAQVSFRQAVTPDRLLGRMNASMRFLVWGTQPIGAIAGGALGEWLGTRTTLWITLGLVQLASLPVLLSPLRTMRDLPHQPDDQVSEPVMAVGT